MIGELKMELFQSSLFDNKNKQRKPNGYWTKDKCRVEAQKYITRFEFQKASPGAYQAARRSNWLDRISSHMEILSKPRGYWSIKENCIKEALKQPGLQALS